MFEVVGADVDNQNDLLPEIVERDNLIEQHEVHIPEPLLITDIDRKGRFRIFDIIIGEISDKSAGKRRQKIESRALVFGENPPDGLPRMRGILRRGAAVPYRNFSVRAGKFKLRVKAEKRIPSPRPALLYGFQKIAAFADFPQLLQNTDRRACVGIKLRADRNHAIIACCRNFPCFPQSRSHFITPSLGDGKNKKPVPDIQKNVKDEFNSRCHLDSRQNPCFSSGYQHIPGRLTAAIRRRILGA